MSAGCQAWCSLWNWSLNCLVGLRSSLVPRLSCMGLGMRLGWDHERWRLSWILEPELANWLYHGSSHDCILHLLPTFSYILVEIYMQWLFVYTVIAVLQHVVNVSLSGRQTTYKVCHIDIDTSLDKVVDLLQQAIPTCLQQFHLLDQHGGGRKRKVEGRIKKGVTKKACKLCL